MKLPAIINKWIMLLENCATLMNTKVQKAACHVLKLDVTIKHT
jgi:hypothetical protein